MRKRVFCVVGVLLILMLLLVTPLICGAEELAEEGAELPPVEDPEVPTEPELPSEPEAPEETEPPAEPEAPEEPSEPREDAPTEPPSVTQPAGDVAENNTFFGRVWEFFVTYKAELLGVIGDAIGVVLLLLARGRLKNVNANTDKTAKSNTAVVSTVNSMIDGYNAMKASYDQYGSTEEERNRLMGMLVAQNTATLDILTTVYANSKNLPQGVKDLVYLKYADCLKTLGDEDKLKALAAATVNEGKAPEEPREG